MTLNNSNDAGIEESWALTLAAIKGFLAICELIIENTKDKNPEDYSGTIPLHLAAFKENI